MFFSYSRKGVCVCGGGGGGVRESYARSSSRKYGNFLFYLDVAALSIIIHIQE